jgi:hypothetical protein
MTSGWRQTIARWFPMFEYLLAGDLRTIFVLLGVLFVSWYLLTEYFWQLLFDSRHEELEYLLLVCPAITFAVRARRVRRGINKERILQPASVPLAGGPFPPAMLAAMCNRLVIRDAAAQGFFRWMGKMLRKADASRLLSLDEIPKAWRRRWTFWAVFGLKTSIPLGFAVLLASPWQFYLGHALARGLDSLTGEADYVGGSEICELSTHGKCSALDQQNWAGDMVSLRGDAPDAGRLRIQLRNWPRSGRYVHFKSQGLYVVNAKNSGIDLMVPVRGRVLELPYFVNDTNTWTVWAEIEYFPFRGEKFVTAAYSGMRVPAVIPPTRYHNVAPEAATQGR